MPDQSKETMKVLLGKFAQSDLLLLSEAATKLKVTEKYLEGLLRSGKIKGFKVGEHWFVEEAWLDDFRRKIKQSIQEAVPARRRASHSTRSYVKVYRTNKQQSLRPKIDWWPAVQKWAWSSVGLAVAMICLAFFCVPFISIGMQKQELAAIFLNGVFKVYETPRLEAERVDRRLVLVLPSRIDDEALTRFLSNLWQSHRLYRPGQVAGETDVRPATE